MMPDDMPELMYVVTTKDMMDGAVVLGDQEMLSKVIPEKIGENRYFVIGSSVHEVLVLPESRVADPAELQEMCKSVNNDSGVMHTEDILSNNVYFYNGQKLQICNTIEEMQTQLEESMQNLTENVTKTAHVGRGV